MDNNINLPAPYWPRKCTDEVKEALKDYKLPQNFCVLDLDEKCPHQLYKNMHHSIGNHRFWTLMNSSVIYQYDVPESTSWSTPNTGHYLQFVKVQGNMICFVGNASTSWMHGVITKDHIGEFKDEEIVERRQQGEGKKKKVSQPPQQKKKTAVSEKRMKYYIDAEGWQRKDFPVTANYGEVHTADLGPQALRNSCLNLLKYLRGDIEPSHDEIDAWATIVIVQFWDSSRNDDVMEKVLEAYHPFTARKCMLGMNVKEELKDWRKIGQEVHSCINKKATFKKVGMSRPTSVRQAIGIVRQLYGPVKDHTPFKPDDNVREMLEPSDEEDHAPEQENRTDDDFEKENNGRDNDGDKSPQRYPSWILKRFAQNDPEQNVDAAQEDDIGGYFEYFGDQAEAWDKKQNAPVSQATKKFEWACPLQMDAMNVAPALVAGYTPGLKRSELASGTSIELASMRMTGLRPAASGVVTAHPLKKLVCLERRGGSPKKAFHVDKAAGQTLFRRFWNKVQVSSKYQLTQTLDKTNNLSDPSEKSCRVGPIVTERQEINSGNFQVNCWKHFFCQPTWSGNKYSDFEHEMREGGLRYSDVKQVTLQDSDEQWGWRKPCRPLVVATEA